MEMMTYENGCFVQAGVDAAVLVFCSLRLCVEKNHAANKCHFGMNFDRIPFARSFLDFFGEQDFVTYVMAAPGYGSQKI